MKIKRYLRRLVEMCDPREKSFALDQLDLKLEPFVGRAPGFFVEAGANDGFRYSNTLFFERYRGWRGMLVEPVPELAERCRRNRPRCIVENVALVSSDYSEETAVLRYCDMMSVVVGAMGEEAEEAHVRRGCEVQGIAEPYQITVPVATLSELLDANHVRCVDLLSLDVEGFETEVLRGIDFDRHRPRLLLIEARQRGVVDSLLEPLYEPIAELSHHDVLYRLAR